MVQALAFQPQISSLLLSEEPGARYQIPALSLMCNEANSSYLTGLLADQRDYEFKENNIVLACGRH